MGVDNPFMKLTEVEKFKKLTAQSQEIIKLATLRVSTQIDSLQQAQREYNRLQAIYQEAIVLYSEDDNDDFETGYEKARRLTLIEAQFDEACARLGFELRLAAKSGITHIQ